MFSQRFYKVVRTLFFTSLVFCGSVTLSDLTGLNLTQLSTAEARNLFDEYPAVPAEIITLDRKGPDRTAQTRAEAIARVVALVSHFMTFEESLGLMAEDRDNGTLVSDLFYRTASLADGCFKLDIVETKVNRSSDTKTWAIKEIEKACRNEKLGKALDDELVNHTFRAMAEAAAVNGVALTMSNLNQPDVSKRFIFAATLITGADPLCWAMQVRFVFGNSEKKKRIDVCLIQAQL